MEASEQNISTPCTDRDKAVLEIMDRAGWGLTIERIAEYAQLLVEGVRESLLWLKEHDLVETRYNDTYGHEYWYLQGRAPKQAYPAAPNPVRKPRSSSKITCPDCGKKYKNLHGLNIHQAKCHVNKAMRNIWVDRSEGPLEKEIGADSMTMDLNLKSIGFVQDLIARFATLPGAEISVTVKFSKGVSA